MHSQDYDTIEKKRKRLKEALVVAAIVFLSTVLLFFGLHHLDKTLRFIDHMPTHIEPSGILMYRTHVGLFNQLIPDACGTTAIYISDETVEQIKKKGLTFLNSRSASRSGRYEYKPWKKLPAAGKFHYGESLVASVFGCAGKIGIPARKIKEGLMGGNGFSSGSGYSVYYVFPDQKLFVNIFYD